MTHIDLDGGFSIHEYRASLKLLSDNGDRRVLENRAGLGCPGCEKPFEVLVVSDRRTTSFDQPPDGPFCIAHVAADDKLLLLTHSLE